MSAIRTVMLYGIIVSLFCISCAPQRATFIRKQTTPPSLEVQDTPLPDNQDSNENLLINADRPKTVILRHAANREAQQNSLKEYLATRRAYSDRPIKIGDYRENRMNRLRPERQTIVSIADGVATANTTVLGEVTATSTIQFEPAEPQVNSIDHIVEFLAAENAELLWAELYPYIAAYFKLPRDKPFADSTVTLNLLKANWLKIPDHPFQLVIQVTTTNSAITPKGPFVIEIRLQPKAPSPLHIVHLAAGGLIPNFVLYHFDEVGYVSP